jgi:hypothetical protein
VIVRYAVYARYSAESKSATSIDDQHALCRSTPSPFDVVLVEDMSVDRGLRGLVG